MLNPRSRAIRFIELQFACVLVINQCSKAGGDTVLQCISDIAR